MVDLSLFLKNYSLQALLVVCRLYVKLIFFEIIDHFLVPYSLTNLVRVSINFYKILYIWKPDLVKRLIFLNNR